MPMTPEDIVRRFTQAKTLRNPHETDWRYAAAYCLPQHYASWQTEGPGHYDRGNRDTRRIAYDSTGQKSLPKYRSILNRMATPQGVKWHGLTASDESLRRIPAVARYFEGVTNQLHRMRMHPRARFQISALETYGQLGVYGNGPQFIGVRGVSARNPVPGIKYVSKPMRDVFWTIDDDGNRYETFCRFWLNASQFKLKFPNVAPPERIAMELEKPNPSLDRYFEFVHYVAPRDEGEYDREAIGPRSLPYRSVYVSIQDKEFVGEEGGYRSDPWNIPRVDTVAGDGYGYSPAVLSLASMGTASGIKKVVLKQGNRAVDPAWLTADHRVNNGTVDNRPGAINPGGLDRNGNELIKRMQTGDFRVSEVMLQDERIDIEDNFFVTLFQILQQTPEMTATEVIERVSERTALLAPTMGRLQSEMLGPMVDREIELLDELGVLPPPPPELIEAQGDYEVVYTSPMARSINMEEVSGFFRLYDLASNAAAQSGNPAPLDNFNLDAAIPEAATTLAVPTRWMNEPSAIEEIRSRRSEQQQNDQLVQNAAGLAAAGQTALEAQNGGQ